MSNCPRCQQQGKPDVEMSRIEPVADPRTGGRMWKCLCPQCSFTCFVPDVKYHQCPHCGNKFAEPVPYVSNTPGV